MAQNYGIYNIKLQPPGGFQTDYHWNEVTKVPSNLLFLLVLPERGGRAAQYPAGAETETFCSGFRQTGRKKVNELR